MNTENHIKNFNKELSNYFAQLLGEELNDFLVAVPQDRAIRINTLKTNKKALLKSLNNKAELTALKYSPLGYKIENEKYPLSQTMEFFKGHFAFQGASSQIPPIVLNPKPGEKVLDIAASPGSKSTQMGIMMENSGELIVNDSNLNRMQALNTNTQKTGLINHCSYYLAGERLGRLFPEYFDKVLLDTPCTGLGTLATHREVMSWWSYIKLEKLAKIQKQLIVSALKACKVNGEIVYSTCSVTPEENELIINEMLEKYPIEVLPITNSGLSEFDVGITEYQGTNLHSSLKYAKRIWPHKHNMEGFFVIRLRKTAEYFNKNNPKELYYLETQSFDHPDVKHDLMNISQSWGIDTEIWQYYRYIRTSDRIWMLNGEITKIVRNGFTNAGLLLADERMHIWKLSHQAIQYFEDKITKRIIILDQQLIEVLFSTGKCKSPIDENGYFAISLNDKPFAVIYAENGILKIKLSHLFNFQKD